MVAVVIQRIHATPAMIGQGDEQCGRIFIHARVRRDRTERVVQAPGRREIRLSHPPVGVAEGLWIE